MNKNKKGFDGIFADEKTSVWYKVAGVGVSLAVIFGVVWVASKAWKKGEA